MENTLRTYPDWFHPATELAGRADPQFNPQNPAIWRGWLNVEKPGDTFLDLRSWGKGVLWVNGRCLGRFWNIGPTQTARRATFSPVIRVYAAMKFG